MLSPFSKEVIKNGEEEGKDDLAVAACNELGVFCMTSRYKEGTVLYEKSLKTFEFIGTSMNSILQQLR